MPRDPSAFCVTANLIPPFQLLIEATVPARSINVRVQAVNALSRSAEYKSDSNSSQRSARICSRATLRVNCSSCRCPSPQESVRTKRRLPALREMPPPTPKPRKSATAAKDAARDRLTSKRPIILQYNRLTFFVRPEVLGTDEILPVASRTKAPKLSV